MIELNMLWCFANELVGTFTIDEGCDCVSFVPHEIDGDWNMEVYSFVRMPDEDICAMFNASIDPDFHVCLDEFEPVLRRIEKLILIGEMK